MRVSRPGRPVSLWRRILLGSGGRNQRAGVRQQHPAANQSQLTPAALPAPWPVPAWPVGTGQPPPDVSVGWGPAVVNGRVGYSLTTLPSPPPVRPALPPPVEDRSGPPEPWEVEPERAGGRVLLLAGRALVWGAAAVVMIAGLRQIIWGPGGEQVSPAPPASSAWPDAQAQQVATRFASEYLSFSEDDPQSRQQVLAELLPSGADATAGWDGHGRQGVLAVVPGEVRHVDDTHAVVRIEARVQPFTRPAGTGRWEAGEPGWRSLAVAVAVVDDQVVITGLPAFVGRQPPPGYSGQATPANDSALTSTLRGEITRFFTAYADGSDVDAYTAPGVDLAGLGGAVAFDSLESFTVYRGSGDQRDAVATVRWASGSGGELRQSYRLRLVRVDAGRASRWFVAEITAGG